MNQDTLNAPPTISSPFLKGVINVLLGIFYTVVPVFWIAGIITTSHYVHPLLLWGSILVCLAIPLVIRYGLKMPWKKRYLGVIFSLTLIGVLLGLDMFHHNSVAYKSYRQKLAQSEAAKLAELKHQQSGPMTPVQARKIAKKTHGELKILGGDMVNAINTRNESRVEQLMQGPLNEIIQNWPDDTKAENMPITLYSKCFSAANILNSIATGYQAGFAKDTQVHLESRLQQFDADLATCKNVIDDH
jgi:hypothetical protein